MNSDIQNNSIMIVDDLPANLKLLEIMLQETGNHVSTFTRGKSALEAANKNPPDIILLDINMPEMDGFEVCALLKEDDLLKDIPVIFISALTETEEKIKAFTYGGVDYITKPFNILEVQARVKTHLTIASYRHRLIENNKNLEVLVQEKTDEIYESQIATIFALAKLAENRDSDTGKHVERVQSYTKYLTERMRFNHKYSEMIGEQFITNIFHATPLHDIGKVAIPDNILLKPGKLSKEEFEVIKTHTVIGAETLKAVQYNYPNNSFISLGVAITCSHHERWDGQGYPRGTSGENIPLAGRIMAIADVYDALIVKRVYKPAFSHEEAREIIIAGSGTQFDPEIVSVFQTNEAHFKALSEHF